MMLEPGLITQDEEDVGGSRETEKKGNMGGASHGSKCSSSQQRSHVCNWMFATQKVIVMLF